MNTRLKNQKISGPIVLLALLMGTTSGCGLVEEQKAPTPVQEQTASPSETAEVKAVKLVNQPFTSKIEATGTALPVRESVLSSEVPGKIVKILVTEGEQVKKGQVLMRFNPKGFHLGVERAKASVYAAQTQLDQVALELNRITGLVSAEAAPKATLDQLKAQHDGARAQLQMANVMLKQARKGLADSELRAPYNSVVSEILREEGEFCPSMPQTMLLEVVDTSSLEVQTFLPEEVAADISLGQVADVEVKSGGLKTTGKVIFVSNRLQSDTQTFEIRVRIDNPEGRIKGGAFTRISLVRRSITDAILVPLNAVGRNDNGKPFVFLAKGQKALKVPVKLGESQAGKVIVIDGLQNGQMLITSQLAGLKNGVPVIVKREKELSVN